MGEIRAADANVDRQQSKEGDKFEVMMSALEQIERLAREGTREGHVIRDAIQEIASKALAA